MASIIAQNCYSAAPLAGALVETKNVFSNHRHGLPHPSQVR